MPNKYGNRKTEVDGRIFDSRLEAARYQELLILQAAGEITALQLQPQFELLPAFVDAQGKQHRKTVYIADFIYSEGGKVVVEDVKSSATKTAVFKIKLKLFQYKYSRLYELRIVE